MWLCAPKRHLESSDGISRACLPLLHAIGYVMYVFYSMATGLIVAPGQWFFAYLSCVDTTPVSAPSHARKIFALVCCEALHIVTNTFLRSFVVVYMTLVHTSV